MTMTQIPMLGVGSFGMIELRLRTHRGDPATSYAAARKMVASGRLNEQQRLVLEIVMEYGPGTIHELATREAGTGPAQIWETEWKYTLARRLPELQLKRLVRVQQDPTKPCRCKGSDRPCHCQDVIRDGSRVWEAI